jgi:hypothetical protein
MPEPCILGGPREAAEFLAQRVGNSACPHGPDKIGIAEEEHPRGDRLDGG